MFLIAENYSAKQQQSQFYYRENHCDITTKKFPLYFTLKNCFG